MKRPALVVLSLIVLFSTLVISQIADSVNANIGRPWEIIKSYPTIGFKSPREDDSIASNNVWLNFTLTKPSPWFEEGNYQILNVAYCVDGPDNVFWEWSPDDNSNENIIIVRVQPNLNYRKVSFSFFLEELMEGKHRVEIYTDGYIDKYPTGHTERFSRIYSSKNFYVDTKPPIVSIISAKIKTYDTSSVGLIFNVNERVRPTYSLDGQKNLTINGNTTLTDLSYGEHNIVVYAMDRAGNVGVSETVYFTREVPFPIVLVIAIVIVVVGGIGVFFYLKKRKY